MDAGPPSIECLVCGAPNPSTFLFCGTCGDALERACPSCSTVMPADLRYCGACGAPLAPGDHVPPSEERKNVSVLFADLAGIVQA